MKLLIDANLCPRVTGALRHLGIGASTRFNPSDAMTSS
jgi:hypothetical protein